MSGKRSDTDFSESSDLYLYLTKAEFWKDEISEEFENEIENIFNDIKLVLECNQVNHFCQECELNKKNKDRCKNCSKCYGSLKVGHALEFYQLLDEMKKDKN